MLALGILIWIVSLNYLVEVTPAMSDRKLIMNMPSGIEASRVLLFMDGESGTWRMFLENEDHQVIGCVDFSLASLAMLRDKLSQVLINIERQPDEFNAELRKTWDD